MRYLLFSLFSHSELTIIHILRHAERNVTMEWNGYLLEQLAEYSIELAWSVHKVFWCVSSGHSGL